MKLSKILKLILRLLAGYRNRPPLQPTCLEWSIVDMKKAEILLTWKKSVSIDVVEQFLRVYINDEYQDSALQASVESFLIGNLSERDRVHVELWSYDGTYSSEKATLDFTVPDLSLPSPPTNLDWKINKVTDDGLPEY